MDLEHFRLPDERDPDFVEDRHEAGAERLQLLAGVPDLADPEAAVGDEGDVVLEPVGGNSR